jgi:cytochrome c oxidase subunit 2
MNRFWSILFLLVPILGAGTCFMAAFNIWPLENCWYPANYSVQGETIDFLNDGVHLLCAFILLGTGLFLAWNLWSYHSKCEGNAKHIHHHRGLEISWSLVPGAILIVLALYQYQSWEDNRLQRPMIETDGVQVEKQPLVKIHAKRFGWEMHYAGPDELLETPDDIYLENLLVVPSGEDIVLQLESYDVIHSFYVPKLRLKHDIIPGMKQFTWFRAKEEAEMGIYCSELCGWGHTAMKAKMEIVSPADFKTWMAQQVESALPKFAEVDEQ